MVIGTGELRCGWSITFVLFTSDLWWSFQTYPCSMKPPGSVWATPKHNILFISLLVEIKVNPLNIQMSISRIPAPDSWSRLTPTSGTIVLKGNGAVSCQLWSDPAHPSHPRRKHRGHHSCHCKPCSLRVMCCIFFFFTQVERAQKHFLSVKAPLSGFNSLFPCTSSFEDVQPSVPLKLSLLNLPFGCRLLCDIDQGLAPPVSSRWDILPGLWALGMFGGKSAMAF